jgi:hypothetical protein
VKSFTIKVIAKKKGRTEVISRDRGKKYVVVISVSQLKEIGAPAFIAVAHELGHVLAYEFKFPGAVKACQRFTPKKQMEEEKEAWNIAKLLLKYRKLTLKSYANFHKEKYGKDTLRIRRFHERDGKMC